MKFLERYDVARIVWSSVGGHFFSHLVVWRERHTMQSTTQSLPPSCSTDIGGAEDSVAEGRERMDGGAQFGAYKHIRQLAERWHAEGW